MNPIAARPIKAVAFDIDGTFYSNAQMYLRSLPWGIRNWGLVDAFRKTRHEIRLHPETEDFHTRQAQIMAGHLGQDHEKVRRTIESRIYGEWEDSLAGIPLVPGLRQAINSFREKGLSLGVLSDFPVKRKLTTLGLEGLFDCVLSTEDVGSLKPHPRSFTQLADCLGVDPVHILYVGNSYHYDVMGARNAGMMSAHFARRKYKDSLANFTFHSYAKLKYWVFENL